MYVLSDLWYGNITPCERFICSDSEYNKLFHQLCSETELFLSDLSPEKKKHYGELEDLQFRVMKISEEDTFIEGFRMGARMILDVVGEHKRQFKSVGETE